MMQEEMETKVDKNTSCELVRKKEGKGEIIITIRNKRERGEAEEKVKLSDQQSPRDMLGRIFERHVPKHIGEFV